MRPGDEKSPGGATLLYLFNSAAAEYLGCNGTGRNSAPSPPGDAPMLRDVQSA